MLYETYEKLQKAYEAGNQELVAALGANWIAENASNPFKENTKEHSLYFQAERFYKRWRLGGIDSRSARRNMGHAMWNLMCLNAKNPHENHNPPFRLLGVIPEEVKIVDEPEAIKGTTLPADATTEPVDVLPEEAEVIPEENEKKEPADKKDVKPENETEEKKAKKFLGVIPEEKTKGIFRRRRE